MGARMGAGDAGVLPVVGALVAVVIVFTIVSRTTCSCRRRTSSTCSTRAPSSYARIQEGFVLLLGEIDLSVGYVAAIGGIVAADLVNDTNWPWWSRSPPRSSYVGRSADAGEYHEARIPSFIVTLASTYLSGSG
jgi:D-xylose transport system permease protein